MAKTLAAPRKTAALRKIKTMKQVPKQVPKQAPKQAMKQAMKQAPKQTPKKPAPLKKSVVVKKPKGIVWDTKHWIKRSARTRPRIHFYKSFHQDENLHFSEAKGLDEPVHEDFRERDVISPPAYTAMVRNGRVWGEQGCALTPDLRLIADVSLEFSWDHIMEKKHSIFRRWKTYPLKRTASTVGLLSFIESKNYFHWLFDVLPRLDLLKRSGWKIDQYIVSGPRMPFHDETLELMGMSPKKMRYTHDRLYLQAKRLVIPSLNGKFTWTFDPYRSYPYPVSYSNWASQFIRQELMFKPGIQVTGGAEKIYITRAYAGQRRLLNEEEILAMLIPLGFTVINPERMSVKDQIRAFASAKCIVSPHGAALANLAFCMPGTKVVELFAPVYTPGYFWMLSNQFGLDYYYLMGDDYVVPEHVKWLGGSHFHVDPGRFNRLLERAGIP